MKKNNFLSTTNNILTFFIAIITSIFIIFVTEDVSKDGSQLFVAIVFFLIYVAVGVPITLVIDSIVKIIPKQKRLNTYLIQLLLYFIAILLISLIEGSQILSKIKALSFYVYIYFHILFLLRLPTGQASFTIIDLFRNEQRK
ncbi:hypothetical protein [Gottfriedia solisilvae]|uniref:hypothetical protein n=1 Tax=Gottfriedia solisilvae TaxID=1516104 RepID=UPI003D2F0CAC